MLGGCAAVAGMITHTAFAQSQPKIVVGFTAGGPGDMLARLAADQLKKSLGSQVIVDNRPGAAGRIAIGAVKASEPDGATMLNCPASLLTLLPHAFRSGEFQPLKDLSPIGAMSELDFALVASAQLGVKSVKEYVELCRSKPSAAAYGTAGAGTPQHMLGARLAKEADITLTHIPYRGGGPALQDVIGGTLPACIGSLSDLMFSARKDGRVRILATAGNKRSTFLPDVPTLQESGFASVVATDWTGLLVTSRTPGATIARLSQSVLEMVKDPEFKAALARFYMEPLALDHVGYAERLQREYVAWGPVVRSTGFTMDS